MQRLQQKIKACKRPSVRIVALICAVCFFAAFLLITALHLNHETREGVTGCARTFEPVCNCDNVPNPSQTRLKPQISIQPDPQHNEETKADCHTCALIHKTGSQLKILIAENSTAPLAGNSLITLMALGLLSSLLATPSLTKLKVKMSN